jgi:predicted MFS family arabinose efflux permease
MRTFRSLRHPNYRLYFVGQLVSLVGSWTQITTLIWLAHEQTHQARWPAFLAAVQIGPTFLLGPWGGALADRVPRRGLIVRTQFAFLACALILLALHLAGQLTVGAMLAVMFAHGVVQAIDLPARLAFVPGLVGREDLSNAVALNSLLFNVARAVGPAVAAVLLESAGAEWCFVVNALSYLAVIGALALIRVPPAADCDGLAPAEGGGGFRVIGRRPGLRMLFVVAGLAAIGGWPLLALLPSFAETRLGRGQAAAPADYGTVLSAVGIGALGAALTAATVGNEVRRKVLLLGGLLAVAVALTGLTVTRSLPAAAGCCVLFGFGMILFFATGQTVVQLGTADADRGKVMGVWAMVLSAGVPLGNLVFGPAADVWGVAAVIAVQAGTIGVAAIMLMSNRVA